MAEAQTNVPSRKRPQSYDGGLCAGHLLVWTWRKLVGGHGDCPLLAKEYHRFAGEHSDALLAAFATFLLLLGRGSRRVLSVGPSFCPGLTPDEERMLRLVAAAQTGEIDLAEAHLAWLVKREAQDGVLQATLHLGYTLAAAGVMLPPVHTGLDAQLMTEPMMPFAAAIH